MKINEGYMSEINLLVNDYKEFCETHGREPNLQKCFAYVKANLGVEANDRDLFPIVKDMFIEEIEGSDLAEAMKVCESFGYRILKEADEDLEEPDDDETEEDDDESFLSQFDENIANLVRDLAAETSNNVTDAEVDEQGRKVTVTFGSEEYDCYYDYDNAVEDAREDVKSLIDDCGGVMKAGFQWDNLGGIEQYLSESDAEDVVREDLENMLSDMSNREKRENYGKTDEDEIVEDQLGEINSYVDYIVDNWGEEQLDNLIKSGSISFDEDKLAEDCVDIDGPEHNLARYDGNEIQLDGWWCYRTN